MPSWNFSGEAREELSAVHIVEFIDNYHKSLNLHGNLH
jgi:hypothetical protein